MDRKSDDDLSTRVDIDGMRVLLEETRAIQTVHALIYTSSSRTREANINRKMVKYLTMTRTFDIRRRSND